jgi:voltage-gated potassium channel
MKTIRQKIYFLLHPELHETKAQKAFDISFMVLILLNIAALLLDSVPSIHNSYGYAFIVFEYISVGIFLIEYILRLWSVVEDPAFSHPVKGRLRFALTPLALADLLSILPSLLIIIRLDFRFLRVLRIFRMLRLFKLSRYSRALELIKNVIKTKRAELLMSFMLLIIMLLFVSCLMYYVENPVQPEEFSSIPQTMWWSVATLTTVGYGDMYPISPFGQFLGGSIAILGIGLFAIPTGIIASGYLQELRNREKKETKCPHCGKVIEKLPV